ncbi:MAG: hypothetical protein EU539_10010, partial [Promethearchaeota archaeon]
MIENKNKKGDLNTCSNCGALVSQEQVKSLHENESIICELCGAELQIKDFSGKKQVHEEVFSLEEKIFIFRHIHELLSTKEFKEMIIHGDERLEKDEVENTTTYFLKSLYDLPFSDELKDRIIINEHVFQEWVQLMFGLMAGSLNTSSIKLTYMDEIITELKKQIGFPHPYHETDELNRHLILFLSRFIHDHVKIVNFSSWSDLNNRERFLREILKYFNNLNLKKQWVKTLGSKIPKRVRRRYRQLLFDMNCNHLYLESFKDFLDKLLDFSLLLIDPTGRLTEVRDIDEQIVLDLSGLNVYDKKHGFSPLFKKN